MLLLSDIHFLSVPLLAKNLLRSLLLLTKMNKTRNEHFISGACTINRHGLITSYRECHCFSFQHVKY